MELEYMGRLMASFAIFAPGLIVVAFLAFLGLVMLAEKAVVGSSHRGSLTAHRTLASEGAQNPAPSRIVSSLTEAVASETAEESVRDIG